MATDAKAKALDPTAEGVQDYIAVKVQGIRAADRAKARGIAPSTVSRNVANVAKAIEDGATLPEGVEVPEGTTVSPYDILGVEGVMPDADAEDREDARAFVDIVQDRMAKVTPKVRRVLDALDALDAAMQDAGDDARTTRLARRFGVDLDAFRTHAEDYNLGVSVPGFVEDALNARRTDRNAEGSEDTPEGDTPEDAA